MFQGADVDGLDKLAQRTTEAADFADDVVVVLRVVVAALKAMSWTGWAAAFAAYLEGTVIPWVQTTGKYLRRFAAVLTLASSQQKEVSGDLPRVALPAGSWTPTVYPTGSAVVAPRLSTPSPAIAVQAAGGGAQGVQVTIVAPAGLGTPAGAGVGPLGGATGGGSAVSAPDATVLPAGDRSSGGSPLGTGGAIGGGLGSGPGVGGDVVGSPRGGADGGASGGGSGAGFSPTAALGSVPAATAGGSGGGDGGPAGGLGPVGTSGGLDAAGPRLAAGDPPVTSSALPLGSARGLDAGLPGDGATGPGALPVVPEGGGLSPALAAAPLGLAGLGAATLGAVRSARAGADGLEADDALDGAGADGTTRPDGVARRPGPDVRPGTTPGQAAAR